MMALGFLKKKKKKPFDKLNKELADLEKGITKTKTEGFKFKQTEPMSHEFGELKTSIGEPKQPPSPPSFPEHPLREAPLRMEESNLMGKDLEIISSKLDAIKAQIESINQRLANLERIAAGEQRTERRW
jgi:prefoldin subunit 5